MKTGYAPKVSRSEGIVVKSQKSGARETSLLGRNPQRKRAGTLSRITMLPWEDADEMS